MKDDPITDEEIEAMRAKWFRRLCEVRQLVGSQSSSGFVGTDIMDGDGIVSYTGKGDE